MPANPRHIQVHLADASHRVPMPGTARLFNQGDEGEIVDAFDPFWINLLNDGSICRGARQSAAPAIVADAEHEDDGEH